MENLKIIIVLSYPFDIKKLYTFIILVFACISADKLIEISYQMGLPEIKMCKHLLSGEI